MKKGKSLIALIAGFAAGTFLGAMFGGKRSSKVKKSKEKKEKKQE